MTENTDLSQPHRHTFTIDGVVVETDEGGVHRHAYGAAPTPAPTPTPTPTGGPAVGLYVAGENPVDCFALGTALGVTPTMMQVAGFPPAPAACDTFGWGWAVGAPRIGMHLCIGALTPAQATLVAERMRDQAQVLDPRIRLAWEMNGNWYPWSAAHLTAAAYIAMFQAAVPAIRAVLPACKIVWNVAAGWAVSGRTWDDTYPGDAFVDEIGVDCYVTPGPADVPPVIAFAQAHSKPWCLPEWGLVGPDDPAYITAMADLVLGKAGGTPAAWQSYFNGSPQDLTAAAHAASKAAYVAAFG